MPPGAPKKPNKKNQITISLEPEDSLRVEKAAKAQKVSKSFLIRKLVERSEL